MPWKDKWMLIKQINKKRKQNNVLQCSIENVYTDNHIDVCEAEIDVQLPLFAE